MSVYFGPEELHNIQTLSSELHCPKCTALFSENGFSSSFWRAEETIYFSWCRACGWLGDIIEITSLVGYERTEPDQPDLPR
ncbi:MAG TPA: hypothetical protein VMU99_10050 [Acidimicrobiales bacterium]|nr:hypothetical protein [Acidimicrobiales bacterium]